MKTLRSYLLGKTCCHSYQKILSSCLLLKNVKIKIYETIILHVASYGCETWSLTLRVEHRYTILENKVARRMFGPKRGGKKRPVRAE
jgi:hypothetical protein